MQVFTGIALKASVVPNQHYQQFSRDEDRCEELESCAESESRSM